MVNSSALPSDETRPLGLIGGIGLTHLAVYEDRPAPDGLHSGCAHVHALTDEAYYVLAGQGFVELHDLRNGYRRVPLNAGDYLQFPPGTLHRVVSTGGLTILAMMGNAGLAERGDARIYFGPEVDAAPDRYAALAALPRTGGREGALQRRDASVAGYLPLLALFDTDRRAYDAELDRFATLHRASAAARAAAFGDVVNDGPAAWLARTRLRLDGVTTAEPPPCTLPAASRHEVLGMCGVLHPLEPAP